MRDYRTFITRGWHRHTLHRRLCACESQRVRDTGQCEVTAGSMTLLSVPVQTELTAHCALMNEASVDGGARTLAAMIGGQQWSCVSAEQ